MIERQARELDRARRVRRKEVVPADRRRESRDTLAIGPPERSRYGTTITRSTVGSPATISATLSTIGNALPLYQ